MKTLIGRKIKRTAETDFLSLVNLIYSLPSFRLFPKVEAMAVLPGMGENWRIIQAIREWENHGNVATHLFVAGFNQTERTTSPTDLETLKQSPFRLKTADNVRIQPEASNTKEQAEWVFEQVIELDTRSLAVFAPGYHLPRAYLTFLKVMFKKKLQIVLVPAPVFIAPDTIIPETGIKAWEMFPGEIKRIRIYQGRGDVATLDELLAYQQWLSKQTFLRM